MRKLSEIQKDFKEDEGKTYFESFWNTNVNPPKHKKEDQISNYLQRELKRKLENVIVNREVQVGKKGGSGLGKADFKIDDSIKNKKPEITVIVEAKGDFNRKQIKKSMETQLKENYLEGNPSNHGIYLVYFTKDYKRDKLSTHQKATIFFEQQAKELSTNGHNIKSFVLDITFAQE